MRPGVIRDLVPFLRGASEDGRIFVRILADDEKGGFDFAGGEQVEKFRGQGGARPVIEGHRDVGTVYVNGIEGDLRAARFGRRGRRRALQDGIARRPGGFGSWHRRNFRGRRLLRKSDEREEKDEGSEQKKPFKFHEV